MNGWLRSEQETAELRETVECPPDASVYRKAGLMALVYREAHVGAPRWHLYVACHRRMPEMPEVLDARAELLPQVEDFAVTLEPTLKNTMHVWELVNPPHVHRGRYVS